MHAAGQAGETIDIAGFTWSATVVAVGAYKPKDDGFGSGPGGTGVEKSKHFSRVRFTASTRTNPLYRTLNAGRILPRSGMTRWGFKIHRRRRGHESASPPQIRKDVDGTSNVRGEKKPPHCAGGLHCPDPQFQVGTTEPGCVRRRNGPHAADCSRFPAGWKSGPQKTVRYRTPQRFVEPCSTPGS